MTSTSTLTHTARIVGLSAVALAVIVAAFGAWFHGAGSASAPEPGILRVALGASTGMTAAAVYLSGTPTTVHYYSSSFTYDPSGPAAGTPCASSALAKDQKTTRVIVVMGNYRKCL